MLECAANIHFKFMKNNVNIQRADEHVVKANCMQYNEQVLEDSEKKNDKKITYTYIAKDSIKNAREKIG